MRTHHMSLSWLAYAAIFGALMEASTLHAADEKPKLPKGYVEEAPLPEGFPPPSELGQIVEKEYPVTRSFSATGKGAFMKCFGYLALNQFKMTAPVVVDYDPDAKAAEKPEYSEMPISFDRMHFLLEKNSLDEPKDHKVVTVGDIPKLRVLSIAQQGKVTADAVKAAEEKLTEHLKTLPTQKAQGEWRILVYNGPGVPRDKVYWEVQLPIEKKVDEVEAGR